MSEEGFLSRWSRRKRAAQRRQRPADEPSRQEAAAAAREPADTRTPETEPELSAEDIARLPRVEDLTPDSDLTQFLRKDVPQALRNAALRRAWALDPRVRDYVGEAREYAYDWNAPGGVPGSGELAPDEIRALLQRVIGSDEGATSAPPQQAAAVAIPDSETGDASSAEANSAQPPIVAPQRGASDASAAEPETTTPPPRRHGGALPI